MGWIALVVAALASGAAGTAFAGDGFWTDERPPASGTPFLIVGGVLSGVSLLDALGTGVLCAIASSDDNRSVPDTGGSTCVAVGLAISGSLLVGGLAMLIVGGVERSNYNEWTTLHGTPRRKPPRVKSAYEHAWWGPLARGMVAGYKTSF